MTKNKYWSSAFVKCLWWISSIYQIKALENKIKTMMLVSLWYIVKFELNFDQAITTGYFWLHWNKNNGSPDLEFW